MQAPPFSMIVLATSYGGPRALLWLVQRLGADMPVPVVVVQHLSSAHVSNLRELLAARARMHVEWAAPRVYPRAGRIYLAPPAHHLLIDAEGRFDLADTPPVHCTRPAADVLFASAARHYRRALLGVVLTGRGHDGTAGARAIRREGGVVIVQDPHECAAPGMPQSVLSARAADFVLGLRSIPDAIVSLLTVPITLPLFGLPVAS